MIETALVIGLNAVTWTIVGIGVKQIFKMNRELGEHSRDIKYIKQQINNHNDICEESDHGMEND